jgi:hypothetical protein
MFDQNLIVGLIILAVVVLAVYAYAPRLRGMLSGFGMEGFATDPANMKKMIALCNYQFIYYSCKHCKRAKFPERRIGT